MKKLFFTFYFLLYIFYSNSQNLVPNYNFEDTLQCPDAGGQINFAQPWYSANTSSPDYFNQCGNVGFKTPLNVWGYQYPKSGQAYAAIGVFGSTTSSLREYIQVQLTDTLIVGNKYCVSFYVSHTGISHFATYMPIIITQIGLLFSNNAIITNNTAPLNYTPQIVSSAGVYLSDTVQWIEIAGTYTALGGERFITIGNFKNDAATDTMRLLDNGQDPQGYYYVDDVSVTDCTNISVNEIQKDYGIKLYPNPTNGELTIEYHLAENDKAILTIYDITGKKLNEQVLNLKASKLLLDESELPAGVYYYSITVNNSGVKTEKLVILK